MFQEQVMRESSLRSNSRASHNSAIEFLNEKPVVNDSPFYKKRKWQLLCLVQTPIITVVTVILAIYVIFPAIAQTALNQAYLNVQVGNITNPKNDSFDLSLQSTLTNTGPFPARITFTSAVDVYWENLHIGTFNIDPVSIKGGHGSLTQQTRFNIIDVSAFGNFSKQLITQPSFTWTLKASVNIVALNIHKNGLSLNKAVTINGFNSFKDSVKLLDFQLPENDPNGGIALYAKAELINHSPFQIPLGFVEFALSYNGTNLGPAYAINQVLSPGSNVVPLYGRLLPHTSQNDLDTLGNLFTNYVNNQVSLTFAQGIAAYPDNKTAVGWLSEGLQALNLSIPLVPPAPLTLIQSIDIGSLNLAFTPATAYAPVASSNDVTIHFDFPFGFSIAFEQIANAFSLIDQQNDTLASLSAPYGPATANFTAKEIFITLPQGRLSVPNHELFKNFTYDLTNTNGSGFNLSGAAAVKAQTPLGPIVLSHVKFNVVSSLLGLQGLNAKQTLINSVDVTGGTAQQLNLAVNATIYNPSNLILSLGDVLFNLDYQNVTVGSIQLTNLTLQPGNNAVLTQSAFNPNASPQGKQLLNDFAGKRNNTVAIAGYNGSTSIDSLAPALAVIKLAAVLPGLSKNLVSTARITIPTTIGNDHLASSFVTIENPFSGALNIGKIVANVTSDDIFVGAIQADANLSVGGRTNATSASIPLLMNLNPGDVFSLVKVNALKQNMSTAALDGLVQLGGIVYTHAPAIGQGRKRSLYKNAKTAAVAAAVGNRRLDERDTSPINPAVFTGFNLPSFILQSLSKLQVDIALSSTTTIGNYTTALDITQSSVSAGVDNSINNLLPVLGQPIVQKIVDAAVLSFSTININNPTNTSFGTHLVGAITNTGPLTAVISFPEPLAISWNGQQIGALSMPAVTAEPGVGAVLNLDATFQVSNVDALTNFTKYLLNEPSFVWDITANNVSVMALGANFTGITLTKQVTLNGMNKFNQQVIIESFNLPANDPAGGISLTLQTSLYNPSNVGIQVGNLGFNALFGTIGLGPVAGTNVALAPLSINQLALSGRLVHQDTPEGTSALSTIFTNFIHGQNSSLTVVGAYASPSGQNVQWLNNGITSLSISGVNLPGQVIQVIKSISLVELALQFSPQQAYSPPTSSDDSQAGFYIPFGFPLDITNLAANISAVYNGQNVASLSIPMSNAVTDTSARILTFGFGNVPFVVQSGQQDNFNAYTKALTISQSLTFGLVGTTNAITNTAAGVITISDIPINVQTTLGGLDGLNAKPTVVQSLDVTSGTSQALEITLAVVIFNPSNLTLGIGDTAFGLVFEDHQLGAVNIKGLTLNPGNNSVTAISSFMPQGDSVVAGQTLLENFIQGVLSIVQVQGNSASTQVASLVDALAQIKLTTNLPALTRNLVTAATVLFTQGTISNNFGVATTTFTLANPFTASIGIKRLNAEIHYNDLVIGKISTDSISFSVNGHSTQTSANQALNFNMDIPTLVRFLQEAASASGTDIGILDALFKYLPANDTGPLANFGKRADASFRHLRRAFADGSGDSPTNPNIVALVLKALSGLKVNLTLDSTILLDEYQTDLVFNQYNVPAAVDQSISYIVQYLGTPIVQNIVNGAVLTFTQADLFNLRKDNFDIHLVGSLSNAGPVDAAISTPKPLSVLYNGKHIGDLTLPTIDAHGGQTANLDLNPALFSITDQNSFTSFLVDALHNKQFTWNVTGTVTVTALGLQFENIALTKSITLLAFNGLLGINITSFNAPSDAPDGQGIEIVLGTLLPNPAQIGITLGQITFHNYFEGTYIGPVVGNDVTLTPQTTAPLQLEGQLIPQTSSSGQQDLGNLFSQYLHGQNSNLAVIGYQVTPPGTSGTEVTWLNDAFKTLNLSVVLPGNKTVQIVKTLTIDDLELVYNQDQSVLASSQNTLAGYQNPFGFSLGIGASSQMISLALTGEQPAVELDLPMAPARTANNDTLFLSFQNKTLKILNEGAFQDLNKALTDDPSANLIVNGSTDILALTKAGPIPISGIPITNIPTSLTGINSFGHVTEFLNVDVNGGTPEYVRISLLTSLNNPSNLTISTANVNFDVHVNSPDGPIAGQAYISALELKPGANLEVTEFRYNNNVDAGAKVLFSQFLEGITTTLYIRGSPTSTKVEHLLPGLEGIVLLANLAGVPGPKLVQSVTSTINILSALTGEVQATVDFVVGNPLNTSLDITQVAGVALYSGSSNPSYDGKKLGDFSVSYSDGAFVAPGQSITTKNPASPTIQLLDLPPLLVLLTLVQADADGLYVLADLSLTNTAKVGGTGGFEVSDLLYSQSGVKVRVSLSLLGIVIPTTAIGELEQLGNGITQEACSLPVIGGILKGTPLCTESSTTSNATTASTGLPLIQGSSTAPAVITVPTSGILQSQSATNTPAKAATTSTLSLIKP